jgi:hypothetical protein
MSSLSDDHIRHMMLEVLHKAAKEAPTSVGLSRDKMKDVLQIPENKLDFNMFYLRDKQLVRLYQAMGTPWESAEITAYGIDVVEDKEKYKDKFPFIQTTIQEIHGDVYAPVIQAVNSQVNFSQQITDAFKQAYNMVETKGELPPEEKEEIKKNLKLLEEELKNKEPDAGKIQGLLRWLKQNANWVVPTIIQVILKGIEMALSK